MTDTTTRAGTEGADLLKEALGNAGLLRAGLSKTRSLRRPLRVATLLKMLEKSGATGGAAGLKPASNNVTTPSASSSFGPKSPVVSSTGMQRGQLAGANSVGQLSPSSPKPKAPKLQDLGVPPSVPAAQPPMQVVAMLRAKQAQANQPAPAPAPAQPAAPAPAPAPPPANPAAQLPIAPVWQTQPWETQAYEQSVAPPEGLASKAWSGAKGLYNDVTNGPIGDIGSGAVTGAMIGSIIPGVGTGIGALAGTAYGSIKPMTKAFTDATERRSYSPQYTNQEALSHAGIDKNLSADQAKAQFLSQAGSNPDMLNDPVNANLYRYYTMRHGFSIPNNLTQAEEQKALQEGYEKQQKESSLRAIRFLVGQTKEASDVDRRSIDRIVSRGMEKNAQWWRWLTGGAEGATSRLGRAIGPRALYRAPLALAGGGLALGGLGLNAITPSEQQAPGMPWGARAGLGALGAYGGWQLGNKVLGDHWYSGPLGALLGSSIAPSLAGGLMGGQGGGGGGGGLASPLVGGIGTGLLYKYLNEHGDLPDFLKNIPGGALTAGLAGSFLAPAAMNTLGLGGQQQPAY